MNLLETIILFICGFSPLLAVMNALSMRVVHPRAQVKVSGSVSVLVPMRNEEKNVNDLISSLSKSTGLSDWNVTALDDASTDETAKLLSRHSIEIISGEQLPEGWLGKNWACHQLARSSDSEYLVFIDADVRVHPSAIASSITLMEDAGWDFISPYPRQIAVTWAERLIQPLLQWSWLSSVPIRFAQRFRIASMTIANGQFFIVKRNAYLNSGGHSAIRNEVLDDLRLARLLIEKGYSGGVAEGSSIAECRMYENTSSIVDGYTKSLWTAFGGLFGTLFAALLLIATQIIPIAVALSGSLLGWLAFFLSALSHGISALRTKSTPSNIVLHPIATLFLLLLIVESFRRKRAGSLIWRDRNVN